MEINVMNAMLNASEKIFLGVIQENFHLPFIHYFMLWAMFLSSFPGLIFNLIICILTFHPVVNGDYKWFIFNLSMIDMIYSVSNIIHAQFMLFANDYDGMFCKISAILHWYCVLVTHAALLPITFNRLCSLRYNNLYNRISSPFYIFLTLVVCDLSPLLMLLPYHLLFSDIVRFETVHSCDFVTPNDIGGLIYGGLLLLEPPLIFVVLIYINLRILLIVRVRKTAPIGDDDRRMVRLKETNNLMRTTVLQAAVPMLVQIPILITTTIFIIGGHVAVQWDTFSVCVHSINPIADAMITFLMVKSYSKALRAKFSKVVPDVEQEAMAPTAARLAMSIMNEWRQNETPNSDTLPAVALVQRSERLN